MNFQKWTDMRWLVTLFSVIFLSAKESRALKCYQCIAIECPASETQLFCESIKEYLLNELSGLYHNYGQKVPLCPSPEDATAWEELRSDTRYKCDAEKEDDATCQLGRFKITTEIFETGKNITSYGTAVGCAKFALLKLIRQAVQRNECDLSKSKGKFRHSLRHYLEIEHCARAPDMCREDFCIPPTATQIKQFNHGESQSSFSLTLVIGIFLLLALAIIVLTFLAPFFNG